MSIRVDSAQLIPGSIVVGGVGLGVPASSIPPTGDSGAGYLFNDIAAPSDEMRGEILTWPSAGTLAANEDSSFSFTGAPDGVYTATYAGYRNGVQYSNPETSGGEWVITLTIGSGAGSVDLAADTSSVSVASAALTTQITLSSAASAVSSSSAELLTQIALAVVAASASAATADLGSAGGITLQASAISFSSAAADLLTAIELHCAAASQSTSSVSTGSTAVPIEYRRVELAIDGKMIRYNTQVHQASDVLIDVVVTGEIPAAVQAKYVVSIPARTLIARLGQALPPPPNLIEVVMPVGIKQTPTGFEISISHQALQSVAGRLQHEFSIKTDTGAVGFVFTGELQVKPTNSRY